MPVRYSRQRVDTGAACFGDIRKNPDSRSQPSTFIERHTAPRKNAAVLEQNFVLGGLLGQLQPIHLAKETLRVQQLVRHESEHAELVLRAHQFVWNLPELSKRAIRIDYATLGVG